MKLTVNKKWASGYDERKRRQELGRARELGLLDGATNSEDDESEDEGEALTSAVEYGIRATLQAIRNKDPRIYDKTTKFFKTSKESASDSDDSSSDDDAKQVSKSKSKQKTVTAKDILRQQLVEAAEQGKTDAFEDDDDVTLNKRTLDDGDRRVSSKVYDSEQAELRKAFLDTVKEQSDKLKPMEGGKKSKKAAATPIDDDDAGAGDDDGDDFLKVKQRARRGEDDSDDDGSVASADRERLKELMRSKDGKLAAHAGEMEDPEGFLDAFVSSKAWKTLENEGDDDDGDDNYGVRFSKRPALNHNVEEDDDAGSKGSKLDDIIEKDEEDEEELWRADDFEAKYNFRFEEPNGGQIVTHARVQAGDTLRRKDTKRKDARDRKQDRKDAERAEKEAETRRLMNLKRAEVKSCMSRIRQVAGSGLDMDTLASILGDDLDKDFDPAEHDKRMAALFGGDYYAQEETEANASAAAAAKAAVKLKPTSAAAEGGDDDEDGDDDEEDGHVAPWVFGDGPRPAWAGPSAEELANGADDLGINGVVEDIDGEGDFDGDDGDGGDDEEEEGDGGEYDAAVKGGRNRRESKRKRESKKRMGTMARIKAQLAAEARAERQKEKHGLAGIRSDDPDEVLALGFEDVIAGGLKTRFKYQAVEPNDFGLSVDEILMADDKDLNSYVGLRRIAPYRESEWHVPQKVRQRAVASIRERVQAHISKLGIDKPNVVGGKRARADEDDKEANDEESIAAVDAAAAMETEDAGAEAGAAADAAAQPETALASAGAGDGGEARQDKKKRKRKHKSKGADSAAAAAAVDNEADAADDEQVSSAAAAAAVAAENVPSKPSTAAVQQHSSSSSSSNPFKSHKADKHHQHKQQHENKQHHNPQQHHKASSLKHQKAAEEREKAKHAVVQLPSGATMKSSRLASYGV